MEERLRLSSGDSCDTCATAPPFHRATSAPFARIRQISSNRVAVPDVCQAGVDQGCSADEVDVQVPVRIES